jgi:glycosyltransferase involved in cell wall biosynthesis
MLYGENGRKRVETTYQKSAFIEAYEKLYQEHLE